MYDIIDFFQFKNLDNLTTNQLVLYIVIIIAGCFIYWMKNKKYG